MESGRVWLWFQAAFIRAVKTFAQTAVAMITVGACFGDIDWMMLFSVSGVAFIASLLTSVAGLPEVKTEEELAGIEIEKAKDIEEIAQVMKLQAAKHSKKED